MARVRVGGQLEFTMVVNQGDYNHFVQVEGMQEHLSGHGPPRCERPCYLFRRG